MKNMRIIILMAHIGFNLFEI